MARRPTTRGPRTRRGPRTQRKGAAPLILGARDTFAPGDHERAERTIEHMRRMDLTHLATTIRWTDAARADNEAWYAWLMPRLAEHLDVLPCITGTPLQAGLRPHAASPPAEPGAYGELLEAFTSAHGDHFEWVQVWDRPNAIDHWDHRLDTDHAVFAALLRDAAHRMHDHGKRVVLGGMHSVDPSWLERLFRHEAMDHVDAIGIQGFPAHGAWTGWSDTIDGIQSVLDAHDHPAEVWVTATGESGPHYDGLAQLELVQDVLGLDLPRAYWHRIGANAPTPDAIGTGSVGSASSSTSTGSTPNSGPRSSSGDEADRAPGLYRPDGTPTLLAMLLEAGRDPRRLGWLLQEANLSAGPEHVVVTGGAGFVGTNLAHRLLSDGHRVLVYDDLSRAGSLDNLEWLHQTHGNALRVQVADVRDPTALRRAVRGARAVFHLAAQTAVTTSLVAPRADFEANAEGTINVLEAVRHEAPAAFVLFASTNKVYGSDETEPLVEGDTAWRPRRGRRSRRGNGHTGSDAHRPLDFVTPYGCSKGAADQYVLDYAHTYDLQATVFRMSCVYGPHQNGTADQGWVSHFLRSAHAGRPLTIHGDGKQVRDVLHIDDLVDAYLRAMAAPDIVSGHAYDVGGGPRNAISLLELLQLMDDVDCPVPAVAYAPARPGDQRYYVSDIAPLRQALNWTPTISAREGIERLWHHTREEPELEVPA